MPNISVEAKNEALDAMLANVNAGTLRIYTGAAPALPTDAATGTLLAEVGLGNPAFSAASGGAASIAASTPEDSAPASGSAGYVRLAKSDNTGVIDLGVGGSVRVVASDDSGDLLLTTTVAHGYSNGDEVRFFVESGGVLPANVAAGTTYYVRDSAALTFKVRATPAGPALSFADAGTAPFRTCLTTSECALATVDGTITAGVSVSVASLVVSIA